MMAPHPFRLLLNRRAGTPGTVILPEAGYRRARETITAWPDYAPTPLLHLADMASAAQVAAVHWKDESERFGLGSFKALGGAYAVLKLVQSELARRGVANAATAEELEQGAFGAEAARIVVTCATDGNHGRSVAWGARRFGARCVIFVHEGVSQGRRDAIAQYGADIRVMPGVYDDAVREAKRTAEHEGWLVVSDTSYPGYMEVPRDVMQGYRLMAAEALEELSAPPSHVFIQAGVGGVAAAVSVQLRACFPAMAPRLIVVEPDEAACLLASAEAGQLTAISGPMDTVMAGLACGEVSPLAWQELERAAFAFMAVPDVAAVAALRLLARRSPGVIAGESAVAGLAALLLAAREPYARAALGLAEDSRVLLFGTEGATDPVVHARLLQPCT
jgi:diaminopropionate ammonia-lyase